MKILFDYQIFKQQSYGGIPRYFTKLTEHLIKLNHEIKIHCPVLCGDKSSMPEVANDAALYFGANEVDRIRYSMESFFENIKKFTWEDCAKTTLEVYKRSN